jgi:hypothetical protein
MVGGEQLQGWSKRKKKVGMGLLRIDVKVGKIIILTWYEKYKIKSDFKNKS